MTKSNTFSALSLRFMVAAQLVLGTAVISTVVPVASAHAAIFMDTHGAWRGILARNPGEQGFGVETEMRDGGLVIFLAQGDDLSLVLSDPDWRLRADDRLPVVLDIDGDTYKANALVTKAGQIKVEGVTNDVVLQLARGRKATLRIGRNNLVWTVDLSGFAESLTDAVKAYAGK